MWMQIFYKWAASRVEPKPSLTEELAADVEYLHRDTVNRQIRLIDDEFKIKANKAKAEYLLEQIQSSTSK